MYLEKYNYSIWIVGISASILIGIMAAFSPTTTLALVFAVLISSFLLIKLTTKTKETVSILVSLLVFCLFVTPDFSVGSLPLRLDDLIVILLTLGLIFISLKVRDFNYAKPIKWLFLYLIYSLFITIVQATVNGLHPFFLLFFVKEIQYFVYFLIVLYIAKSYDGFKSIFRKTLVVASLLTILWGVYQMLSGNIVGYYGIGIISTSAPSQSGIVLMLTTIFLLYMSLTTDKQYKSIILTVMFFAALALTVATISRTAISILGGAIILYLVLSLFRKKWNTFKVLAGIYFSIPVVTLGYFFIGDLLFSVLERFSRFNEGAQGRYGFWQGFISQSDTMGLVFGNGKGFMQVIVGTLTLKADSQYVRLLIEVGVIGLVLWIFLIGSILLFSIRSFRHNYYDALFLFIITVSFIIVGITQEGYLVTLQGSLYWIMTGFLMGNILRRNNKRVNGEAETYGFKKKRIIWK